MDGDPISWHVYIIPSEHVEACSWSGTYEGMPVIISPSPLDEINFFLPYRISEQPYVPQEILGFLSTCEDRVITQADITA